MWGLPFGLPRVTQATVGRTRVRRVSSNPGGSLLCVITSERVEIWSLVNDVVCLGSASLERTGGRGNAEHVASSAAADSAAPSRNVVGVAWENDASVVVADEACLTFFALTGTQHAQIDAPFPTWFEGRPSHGAAASGAGGERGAVGSATSYIASLFGGSNAASERGGAHGAGSSDRRRAGVGIDDDGGEESRARAIHLDAARSMRAAAVAEMRIKVRPVKIVRMRAEWGAVSCFAAMPPDLAGLDRNAPRAMGSPDSQVADADRHGSLFIGTDSGRVLIAAWSGKLLAWFDAPQVPLAIVAESSTTGDTDADAGAAEGSAAVGAAAAVDLAVDAIARYAAIVTAEGNAFCWKMTEKRGSGGSGSGDDEDEDVASAEAEGDSFSPLRPYLLHGDGASAALCVRFGGSVPRRIAAIGCADGTVMLYYVGNNNSVRSDAVRSVSLSLAPLGLGADAIGGVAALCWTSDGAMLAVGYARCGLSAWSEHGRRVMCTVSDETASSDAIESAGSTAELETVVCGTSALAWDFAGYRLVCSPNTPQQSPRAGSALVSFNFVHTLDQPAPCAALLGRTSLLVLRSLPHAPTTLVWRRFAPPLRYMIPNAPLRLAATALCTTAASAPPVPVHRMAVAGRHGVALFSSVSNRWRLFGDERQERVLSCSSLAWWQSTVVIAATHGARPSVEANAATPGSLASTERAWSHSLVAFPHWHLDRSSVLSCVRLPVLPHLPLRDQAPVLISVQRTCIFVAMADSRILRYRLQTSTLSSFTPRGNPQMSMSLVGEHTLQAHLPTRSPITARRSRGHCDFTFRSLTSIAETAGFESCAVLDSSGCLTYVRVGSSRGGKSASTEVEVLRGVRGCIPMLLPTGGVESESSLAACWLLLDNWRVRAWLPHFNGEAPGIIASEDPVVRFGPGDCTAVVGTFSAMMLVQAAIDPSRSGTSAQHGNAAVPLRWIHLDTKLQPVLHSLLLALIRERNDKATATAITLLRAAHRKAWPHVRRSLELLLHAGIEVDKRESKQVGGADSVLAAVCDVAKSLPFATYTEAFARCGRTIDSARWSELFNGHCAGHIENVFPHCVSAGCLTVAATLLPIFVSLSMGSGKQKEAAVPSWFNAFLSLLRSIVQRAADCLQSVTLANGGGYEGGAWLQVRCFLSLFPHTRTSTPTRARTHIHTHTPHRLCRMFHFTACPRHASVCASHRC